MQVSAYVAMVVSSALCLLFKTARGSLFEGREATVTYPDREPEHEHERNLSCHQCTRSIHKDNCLTMQDPTALFVEHCTKEKKYCMVERRLDDGALTTFTRQCSHDCKPGCKSATASGYVIKKCRDCCKNNAFCNFHRYAPSGATARLQRTSLGVASSAVVALWLMLAL